jgi:cobalamin biosynthesis protein CobT
VPKKENNAEEKKLEELVEDIKLSEESNQKDEEENKEEKDEKQNENENESENENETSKDDNNNENGDDEEGWINPGNLEKIKKESKVDAEQENLGSTKIKVACMTSDFAMQVLINIKIYRKSFSFMFLDVKT